MPAVGALSGTWAFFPGLIPAILFVEGLRTRSLSLVATGAAFWLLCAAPLIVSLLTSVAIVQSSLVVRIGVFGQSRYRQQILLAEIDRAISGKVSWGRGAVEGVVVLLDNGRSVELKASYLLGYDRRRRWIDTINSEANRFRSIAQVPAVDLPEREAIESDQASFWLQHRPTRRRAICLILTAQTLSYLAALGMALYGVLLLAENDTAGFAWIFAALFTSVAAVFTLAAVGLTMIRPKVRVDGITQTIEVGRLPITSTITFVEADQMRLTTGIGGTRLEGTMTDASGIKQPHLHVMLGFGGLVRDDGQTHPLAAYLPAPLAGLSDDVTIVEQPQLSTIVRLCLYSGIRTMWNAGRTNITVPSPT